MKDHASCFYSELWAFQVSPVSSHGCLCLLTLLLSRLVVSISMRSSIFHSPGSFYTISGYLNFTVLQTGYYFCKPAHHAKVQRHS